MKDALGSVQSLLILGGNSEIALATASRMARDRLRTVVLAARDLERARENAERLRADGVESVEVVRLVAEDEETHRRAVDAAFERDGDVDAVLVALGTLGRGGDEQLDEAADVIRTNFVGAVAPTAHAVRRL